MPVPGTTHRSSPSLGEAREGRLLADRNPRRVVELVVAVSALLGVGVIVFGPHVLHGGFYSDDWADAARYHFADSPRYWSSFRGFQHNSGGRPLLALIRPTPHALFGQNASLHLGLALALGVLTAACLYLALRTLGVARLHAWWIAMLALLFPWADSIRLWPSASLNNVAVCFYLLGVVIAIKGLRLRGAVSYAVHGAAVLLYVASVLTYEVAAATALLTGFLYLGRARTSTAVHRWAADVVAVGGALMYDLLATSGTKPVGSFGQRIADIPTFIRQSFSLLSLSLFPFGTSSAAKAAVLLLAAAILGVALVRFRRGVAPWLQPWLLAVLGGVIVIASAYFMLLGSYLDPLDDGISNRGNIVAGIGFVILVYSLTGIGARLVAGEGRAGVAVGLAVAGLIAVGYGIRVNHDESDWRRSTLWQRRVLAVSDQVLPRLPHRATILTFGVPAMISSGPPIFNETWDLHGAVELDRNDPSLRAFPIYTGVRVICHADRLSISARGEYNVPTVLYGRIFFLDIPGRRVERVRNRTACRAALDGFRPGPLTAPA